MCESVYVTYDAVLYDRTDSHKKSCAEMSERGGRGGEGSPCCKNASAVGTQ